MLFEALIAAVIIALLSVSGAVFLGNRGHLTGTNRFIVPIAIGVFLGVIFFELIPETLTAGNTGGSIAIVIGFLAFYLLSHLLHTYHHHHEPSEKGNCCADKQSASMLLLGDAIHNIADGIIIATAFLVNPGVGIATTIGIALHEIPQEIAEFGVLLRAGYSRMRAAIYNLISASTIIFGVFITFVFLESLEEYIWVLTGIAAGNLLFIAASDLIPQLQKEHRGNSTFMTTFIATLAGMIFIVILISWTHEQFGHGHTHEDGYSIEGHDEEGAHHKDDLYYDALYEIDHIHDDDHTHPHEH